MEYLKQSINEITNFLMNNNVYYNWGPLTETTYYDWRKDNKGYNDFLVKENDNGHANFMSFYGPDERKNDAVDCVKWILNLFDLWIPKRKASILDVMKEVIKRFSDPNNKDKNFLNPSTYLLRYACLTKNESVNGENVRLTISISEDHFSISLMYDESPELNVFMISTKPEDLIDSLKKGISEAFNKIKTPIDIT